MAEAPALQLPPQSSSLCSTITLGHFFIVLWVSETQNTFFPNLPISHLDSCLSHQFLHLFEKRWFLHSFPVMERSSRFLKGTYPFLRMCSRDDFPAWNWLNLLNVLIPAKESPSWVTPQESLQLFIWTPQLLLRTGRSCHWGKLWGYLYKEKHKWCFPPLFSRTTTEYYCTCPKNVSVRLPWRKQLQVESILARAWVSQVPKCWEHCVSESCQSSSQTLGASGWHRQVNWNFYDMYSFSTLKQLR